MTALAISVVIPTRNPDRARLQEVLGALQAQTLASDRWEVCLVDNGSTPPLRRESFAAPASLRIVREERPGLLAARAAGIRATTGRHLVFIDDDTVPASDFLALAVAFMDAQPEVGTAGGRILPRYLSPPHAWIDVVAWLLALRDNGPEPLRWSADQGGQLPCWTPIGAGLLARRTALVPGYLSHVETHAADIARISWQGQGAGGVEDKDLVLHCLRAGWATAYIPELVLHHIIPAERLTLAYFEKLLPTVQRLWVQTAFAHGFELRPLVHPRTLVLRKAKAWFVFQAWRSPAHRLRWLASCGQLDGLAACRRLPIRYPVPASS